MNNRKATIYDYSRMCTSIEECYICPLSIKNNGENESCDDFLHDNTNKANEIILKWCDEHPAKTYKDDFFEKYPNTRKTDDGYPLCLKCMIYGYDCIISDRNVTIGDCKACWDMPIEVNDEV